MKKAVTFAGFGMLYEGADEKSFARSA